MYDAQPHVPSPQTSAGRRNPLGLASLIVGCIPTILGFLLQVATPAILTSGDSTTYQVVAGVQGLLSVLTGLTAVILGLIGLTRAGLPRAAAAAGTALGASAVVLAIGGLLIGVVSEILY